MTDIIFTRNGVPRGIVTTNNHSPIDLRYLTAEALDGGAFSDFGTRGDTITVGDPDPGRGLTPGGRLFRMHSPVTTVAIDDDTILEAVTLFRITSQSAWNELTEAERNVDPMAFTNLVLEDLGTQEDGTDTVEDLEEPYAEMLTDSMVVLIQRRIREVNA
jgi:hypothetical protein